jgi:hypothetical protein
VERRGSIDVGGRSLQIVVRSLSAVGALIVDAMAGASVGMPVTVRMDGIAAHLVGVIARIDHNGTFVKFELNEAAAKLVEDLVGGRRAA